MGGIFEMSTSIPLGFQDIRGSDITKGDITEVRVYFNDFVNKQKNDI